MKSMKLDKTVFKAQSFAEAERNNILGKEVSIAERLKMAFHLSCKIYGITIEDALKIDKSVFSARKF